MGTRPNNELPESEDSGSGGGESDLRARTKRSLEKLGRRWREQTEREGTTGKVAKKTDEFGRRAGDITKTTVGKVTQRTQEAADDLSLRHYREEVDRALGEATAVIIAQDAEIAALEKRVARLEARGSGSSDT